MGRARRLGIDLSDSNYKKIYEQRKNRVLKYVSKRREKYKNIYGNFENTGKFLTSNIPTGYSPPEEVLKIGYTKLDPESPTFLKSTVKDYSSPREDIVSSSIAKAMSASTSRQNKIDEEYRVRKLLTYSPEKLESMGWRIGELLLKARRMGVGNDDYNVLRSHRKEQLSYRNRFRRQISQRWLESEQAFFDDENLGNATLVNESDRRRARAKTGKTRRGRIQENLSGKIKKDCMF